jgi:hypothetical protein
MIVLKFVGYMLVLLATVPLSGFLVTGSPKQAWAFTKRWARAVTFLAVIGLAVGGVVLLIIPPPG